MKNTRIPALIPLCLAAMVSREALALGLGSAELESRLGSPLQARIPLRSMEGLDPEQLLISVQPVWDEGSDSVIGGLKPGDIQVSIYRDEQGRAQITLNSAEPIVEPFLNFMLNVRWPQGSLNREYTLLLDLPTTAASFQALPAVSQSSTELPGMTAADVNTANVAATSATPITASTRTYLTQRGDSLWSIAARLRRERGGDQQVLMEQIFALNPNAFIRNARHLLKESATLNIDPAALSSTQPSAPTATTPPPATTPSPSIAAAPSPADSRQERTELPTSAEPVVEAPQGATDSQGDRTAELTASLLAVSQEVEQVTTNIEQMSARLERLQSRLQRLQQEYAQVQGEVSRLRDAAPVDRLAEDGVRGEAAMLSGDVDAGVASQPASADAQLTESAREEAAGLPVANNADPVEATAPESEAVSEQPASGWLWWLWGVAAVAALWWFLRRREKPEPLRAAPPVTGEPPVPAPKHAPDAFYDVFDELDGRQGQDRQGAAQGAPRTDGTAAAGEALAEDSVVATPVSANAEHTAYVSESKVRDAETAAAACLALDDLHGARRILESALQDNDDESLKRLLLDVYAQQGDVSEFETLALQMEFAGISDDALREIAVLRKAMGQRVDQSDSVRG